MTKSDALAVLSVCGIQRGADFHTLDSAKVEALLERAKAWKYRVPKNANGSRARYFHAYLNRLAARED